jgi:hypothetical protein
MTRLAPDLLRDLLDPRIDRRIQACLENPLVRLERQEPEILVRKVARRIPNVRFGRLLPLLLCGGQLVCNDRLLCQCMLKGRDLGSGKHQQQTMCVPLEKVWLHMPGTDTEYLCV